jgi:diketogulonate reductase-like aldo/keto reductase
VTNSQLAIAWVLAKGPNIVPTVGARKRTQLRESLGGLDISLSAEDIARIEQAVPAQAIAGTRYDPRLMTMLDSERAGKPLTVNPLSK